MASAEHQPYYHSLVSWQLCHSRFSLAGQRRLSDRDHQSMQPSRPGSVAYPRGWPFRESILIQSDSSLHGV